MMSKAETRTRFRVGVDTGGTHTDFVLFDGQSGRVFTYKVPSTIGDLTIGIVGGLKEAFAEAGAPDAVLEHFAYATTMVTNLIVEGVDAPVGLITTQGFRDVLEIARASRKPHIYDLQWRPPAPPIARPYRLGVRERVLHTGEVLEPLDEEQARAALRQLRNEGCTSIAVCFLHSYANPINEQRVAALATQECPEIDISLSSDIVREFREYERVSTTALNAYVKRPLGRHLAALSDALDADQVRSAPYIMRGNGGISSFSTASRVPVEVTHSGPMGGIIGGTAIAAACGIRDIITLDMGGTSADVSLVLNSKPVLTTRGKLGPYPLMVPMLDLVTIGAGGGSIGWVDAGNALRVGPRSAGAMPGPACYAQGGVDPTVTDANLFAGRLNPSFFMHGHRQLDGKLSENALASRIAKPLGMSLGESALGIMSIAEAHMANAIKRISIDRGLDPRDFTLVGFGGAGPMHSLKLAEELSIDRVLIPPAPGNVSAMGLLAADVRHDFVQTRLRLLPELEPKVIVDDLAQMAQQAAETLVQDGVEPQRCQYFASVDLRYQGQHYELNLPFSAEGVDDDKLAALARQFHVEHERVYGYSQPARPVQLVNVRLTAVGRTPHVINWQRVGAASGPPVPHAVRVVTLSHDTVTRTPVYRLSDLFDGHAFAGPAIVEYPGSTLFVPPGWNVTYDSIRNAHLVRAMHD